MPKTTRASYSGATELPPVEGRDYSNIVFYSIIIVFDLLILSSGVILGLAFGNAKFERVCAESMYQLMIGGE